MVHMVQHLFRPRSYWAEAVPYSPKKHGALHKNMVQKYGTLPKRARIPHKITAGVVLAVGCCLAS